MFNGPAFKLLPLRDIQYDVTIHESIALAVIKQEFIHPQAMKDRQAESVNAVYKFPKYAGTILSKLCVVIDGDRVIETKLMERPEAAVNLYDDQTEDIVAICKTDDDDRDDQELYRIDIGLVKPGQSV